MERDSDVRELYPLEPDKDADPETGLLIDAPGTRINLLPFPVRNGTRLVPLEETTGYKLYFYLPDIPPELIHTYAYQSEANWTTYSPERSFFEWRTGEWTSPEDGFVRVAVSSGPDDADLSTLFRLEPPPSENSNPPDWMKEEAADLFRRAESVRKKGDVALLLLADTHFTVGGIWEDTLQSLRLAADELHPEAVVHLGDFTDGMLPGKLTGVLARRMLRQLKDVCGKLLCCIGNHDWNCFKGNPQRMNRSECAALYLNREMPSYYEDVANGSLRLVFINSFSPLRQNRYGFVKEQLGWFRHTLWTTPLGAKVLVFSHVPPVAEIHVWSDTILNGEEALQILEKFHRWRGRPVLGWIHGHNHADLIYRKRAFPVIGIGCAKLEDFLEHKPEGGVTWPREKGTRTQELWDLLLIHLSKKSMDFLRFGAGEDRHVELN